MQRRPLGLLHGTALLAVIGGCGADAAPGTDAAPADDAASATDGAPDAPLPVACPPATELPFVLDPGFGDGGRASLGNISNFNALAARHDGSVGAAWSAGTLDFWSGGACSLTSAGQPDVAFGGNPCLGLADPPFFFATGVAARPDGKLVLAGMGQGSVLVQVTEMGLPDGSFGTTGQLVFAATSWVMADVIVDGESLVVAGSVAVAADQSTLEVARVTLAGELLASRRVEVPALNVGRRPHLSLVPGGGILITYGTSAVLLDPALAPVPGFGDQGVVTAEAGETFVAAWADVDGRVWIAGGAPSPMLVRLRADGTRDPGFGAAGRVVVPGEASDQALAAVRLADGSVWLGGDTHACEHTQIMLARFDPAGQPVASFGYGGRVAFSVDATGARLVGLEAAPDGKLLLGGDRTLEATGPTGPYSSYVWRIVP